MDNIDRAKKIRADEGISQSEMAFRMGVSLRTYQRMESGLSAIPSKKLDLVERGFVDICSLSSTLELIVAHEKLYVCEIMIDGAEMTIVMSVDCTWGPETMAKFYVPASGAKLGMWVDDGFCYTKLKNLEPTSVLRGYLEDNFSGRDVSGEVLGVGSV